MHSRAASGRSTFLGSTSSTFFRVVATQKRKYYQAFYVTHGLEHAATTDCHWHNLPSRNWSSRVSSCSIDIACKSSQPGMSSLRSGGNRPHLGRSLTRSPSPLLSFQTQHDVKVVHLQDPQTRCSIGTLQHFRIPGSTHTTEPCSNPNHHYASWSSVHACLPSEPWHLFFFFWSHEDQIHDVPFHELLLLTFDGLVSA